MKLNHFFFILFSAFSLTSCIQDEVNKTVYAYTPEEYAVLSQTLDLPIEANEYLLELPAHLGFSTVMSQKHQATLGRVLFYDKKLSKNGSISCASCHDPARAFTDTKALSEGFDGQETKRNSLALGAFPSFNAYYGFGSTLMFWDERARTVAEQSELTLRDPIEMGHPDLSALASELLEHEYYQILFAKAYPEGNFGNHLSNKNKMLQALDAFVSAIGCFETRFDKGWAATGVKDLHFSDFSNQENIGKDLFLRDCASCHNLGPGFSTSVTAANNGLDEVYDDEGRAEITGLIEDIGVFKVPMLRNVALTAPYMHDGRFESLEEVVDHYSTGIQLHDRLHPNLKNTDQSAKKFNYTQAEKEALVAFMHTLTDAESIALEKYADPFKK